MIGACACALCCIQSLVYHRRLGTAGGCQPIELVLAVKRVSLILVIIMRVCVQPSIFVFSILNLGILLVGILLVGIFLLSILLRSMVMRILRWTGTSIVRDLCLLFLWKYCKVSQPGVEVISKSSQVSRCPTVDLAQVSRCPGNPCGHLGQCAQQINFSLLPGTNVFSYRSWTKVCFN